VRDEIKGTLAREHAREALEKLRSSVQPTFNEAYFGSPAPPPPAGEVTPHAPAPPSAAPAHSPTAAQPATPAGAAEAPKPPPASK